MYPIQNYSEAQILLRSRSTLDLKTDSTSGKATVIQAGPKQFLGVVVKLPIEPRGPSHVVRVVRGHLMLRDHLVAQAVCLVWPDPRNSALQRCQGAVRILQGPDDGELVPEEGLDLLQVRAIEAALP